jgi:hypothetical protein
MGRHRIWLAAVVPLLALTLAGCGGHGKKPGVATVGGGTGKANASPTASVDPQTAMLNFARCMRDHGVDMPDPDADGKVTMGASGGPINKTQMDAAQAACRQYMPNGGAPPSMSPEELEQLRKFAQCMRDHGVQMADPDADNGGLSIQGGTGKVDSSASPGIDKGKSLDDPNFKAAEEACKDKLPKRRNK